MTGNEGGSVGNDDVDNGFVTLTSPPMDLSNYDNPVLTGQYWFVNGGGNGFPNDFFSVRLTNGSEEVEVLNVNQSLPFWRSLGEIVIKDFIDVNDQVRIIFETKDDPDQGHIVEAAVDQILVTDEEVINSAEDRTAATRMLAYPNPFNGAATVAYDIPEAVQNASLRVYNSFGQEVQALNLQQAQGQVEIGQFLPNGLYIVELEDNGATLRTIKVVKAN